jgi:hypothetical protein
MSESTDGDVRVKLRDVYELLQRQGDQLTALTLEVRLANQRAEDRAAKQAEKQADHEVRLRALERKVWALPSLAAIVSLAGLAISLTNVIR